MALDCLPEPCRLCGIALTNSHTMTPFDDFRKEAFQKHCGKGETACTSNFSFSHNVFYSIKDRNYHLCYI